jgi:hypothetical protein
MPEAPLTTQPLKASTEGATSHQSVETRSGRGLQPLSGRDLTYGNVGHDVLPLWDDDGSEPVFVDAGIVGLLRDLNRRGFTTEFSCQGDIPSRRGYISFTNLADLPAVVERLQELLAGEPEIAQRFGWGPDPSSRDDAWSAHTHRTKGVWGFSLHLPAAWMPVLEREAGEA